MKYNTVLIICSGGLIDYTNYPNSYVIGVETGCLDLIRKNITIDLACGDFDKLSKQELELVESHAKKLVRYDARKDYIDGEIAVKHALEVNTDKIILVASGKRFDMSLACFSMVHIYNIEWISSNDYCFVLTEGVNKLQNLKEYKYLSLYAIEKSIVNITDMKYEVNNFELDKLSINAISNEFAFDYGTVEVLSGKVIAIYTK